MSIIRNNKYLLNYNWHLKHFLANRIGKKPELAECQNAFEEVFEERLHEQFHEHFQERFQERFQELFNERFHERFYERFYEWFQERFHEQFQERFHERFHEQNHEGLLFLIKTISLLKYPTSTLLLLPSYKYHYCCW